MWMNDFMDFEIRTFQGTDNKDFIQWYEKGLC